MKFRLFASIFTKTAAEIGPLKSLVQHLLIKKTVIGHVMKFSIIERNP